MYTDQRTTKPDVGRWEQGFCYTPWCKERILYVQQNHQRLELWRIARTPGEGEWLVAAPGPLCPMCGGTLLTSAPCEEMQARKRTS
jgi:hypothetical protein